MIEGMSERWAKGSTRAWRRVRAQVLDRDGHRCGLQLAGTCTTRATHVHHTQPRELVGDDPQYLISACAPCNLAVGDPTRHDPAPTTVAWWDEDASA